MLLQGNRAQGDCVTWLEQVLSRNAKTNYLRRFGSPRTAREFRDRLPVCTYEDLAPYLSSLRQGEKDILFAGKPIAFERTGGSSGGSKLIPYSEDGLLDFQLCVLPWLADTVRRHSISGRAYFSISPVARKPEAIGSVPVGLSDAAYLGELAAHVLLQRTAVPFEVAAIREISAWRTRTLHHLTAARDLELISVWSPTFLLRLLEGVSNTQELWPRLKVISCWGAGPAARHLNPLRRMFPHSVVEPKGLLSTEAVVTIPDENGQPALVQRGFFEFAQGDSLFLESQLVLGEEYEVVATTASGLYRYATGDRVRFDGLNAAGRPILEFLGRDSLTSDLAGEKLTESFVGKCLERCRGFAMLVPDVEQPGYVLISEHLPLADELAQIDDMLRHNPQYAYARKVGQLMPLRGISHARPFAIVEQAMVRRGVRLGDVKPTALRNEAFWLAMFEETSE
jgi:hypothetical protein